MPGPQRRLCCTLPLLSMGVPAPCCSSSATRPSLRGLHGTFSLRCGGCPLLLIVIRGPRGGDWGPSRGWLLPESSQRESEVVQVAIGEVEASRGRGGGRGRGVVRGRIVLAAPPGAHLQAVLAFKVALQVVLLGESLVAQVALIGPVPCVQVHVVLEVIAVQEAGWAVRA